MTQEKKPLVVNPAADLQALPLEFIIAAPLTAVIKAQALAAETTMQFLDKLKGPDGQPTQVELKVTQTDAAGAQQVTEISAPLLALVPVPHLRIHSYTSHFKYEISQTISSEKNFAGTAGVELATGAALTPWATGSLRGSVSSSSSNKEVANRSGTLELTVHAGEADIPAGLKKVLTALTETISVKTTTQPAPAPPPAKG